MEVKQITSYPTAKWSGGETRELTIYPADEVYQNRTFTYRISSATITVPESTFTPLVGYERILLALAGEVVLEHRNGAAVRKVTLHPFEQDSFSGSNETTSYGTCVDFNIISQPGVESQLEVIQVAQKSNLVAGNHYFYYATATCQVTISQGTDIQCYTLKEGEGLHVIEAAKQTTVAMQAVNQTDGPFLLSVSLKLANTTN